MKATPDAYNLPGSRSVATLALFETSTGIGVVWRGCLSFAGRSGLVTSMFLVAPLSTHFNMIKLAPDGTMAAVRFPDPDINRSEERRVGQELVRTCSSRWSQ